MREQWRYFQFGRHHILALPPDAYVSLTVWVHYEDGSIEREHLKPVCLPTLTELTEEEARRLDPVMFRECLERPYYDAPTMLAFYQQKCQILNPLKGDELASRLHRNSVSPEGETALASQPDASGASDKCPVLAKPAEPEA